MTETTVTTQVYQVFIRASAQAIWDAITNPEWSSRYGYRPSNEYELRPGGRYRGLASPEYQAMGMPEVVVGLDHLAVDHDLGHAHRLELRRGDAAVAPAGAQLVLVARAVAVAAAPLGLGDRVPDRLRARPDEHPVDLGRDGGLCHRRHAVPSSSVLRCASADTWRSVYLSIQRSWIRRIGTALRK